MRWLRPPFSFIAFLRIMHNSADMTLMLILFFLSAVGSLWTYIGCGLYESMLWVWVPFALVIAYFWGLFLVWVLTMGLFSFGVNRHKDKEYPPNRFAMWVLGETCFILMILFRVHFHATGMGKVPEPNRKFMIVSNHLSGFDHVGLIALFVKHRMICVSKRGNEKFIVASGWIKKAGYLSIDQGDILSGTRIIEKAGKYISEGTCSVCIAPEGTRNKNFPEPEVLPFHPGSFQMAYQAKCPIVVFAIQNTNMILKRFPLRRTDVYFDCVGVIEYEDYQSLTPAELAAKAKGLIERRFEQKRARFYHVKRKPEAEA